MRESSGVNPDYHLRETTGMIVVGRGAQRKVRDVFLSRYASYLVAMNGDAHKQPMPEQVFPTTLVSHIVTEHELLDTIVALAKANGWLVHHVFEQRQYARRTEKGFPDLVLAHPLRHEVIWAELKSERGRVSPEQRAWIDALALAGQAVCIWRPSDLKAIQEYLEETAEKLTRRNNDSATNK